MCTDEERTKRRSRRKFFDLIHNRGRGRNHMEKTVKGFTDKRPRLLARAAREDIVEVLSVPVVSEPPAPFFHEEGYDPETHYLRRISNRVEGYLEERREEELSLISSPLAA